MKKVSYLFMLTGALCLTACDIPIFVPGGQTTGDAKITSIAFDKEVVDVFVDETYQAVYTINPSNAKNKYLIWSSSAESVATVSQSGLVTTYKAGVSTILAEASDGSGVRASFSLNVKNVGDDLTDITLSNIKNEYYVGDNFTKPTVTAKYKSGSTKVVTSLATFTGFDSTTEGTKEITVSYSEGEDDKKITKTAKYNINVYDGSSNPDLRKTTLGYTYKDYQKKSAYSTSNSPSVGESKFLIIPIWFSDSSNYISESKKTLVKQDIEKAFFGSNEDTGWRSVSSYYNDESHGKLNITGVVSDWYDAGRSSSSFYQQTTTQSQLISSSVSTFFTNNPSYKKTDFDVDKDGYFDSVCFIYACPNYATLGNGNASNLWAYCYWTQQENTDVTRPITNAYLWASYDFMYGAGNAQARTGHYYSYGNTSHCNLDTHTYIHETGHLLGLDDYYDYGGVCAPAGRLSMQDENVGGHDPFSAMALGWSSPYIPTKSMQITIKPFITTGDVILLTPSWNSTNSPFDEYILIELYTPTGVNKFDSDNAYDATGALPKVPGIRVWHVDARLMMINSRLEIIGLGSNIKDPTVSCVLTAFNNTCAGERITMLGDDYKYYNLLQYIRNTSTATYIEGSTINVNNMFLKGDSFSMNSFSNQFINGTKLNSGANLGWSFTVDVLSDTGATITVTRG